MNDGAANKWKRKNLRNTKRLAWWTLAWLVSMALTNFGPMFVWQANNMTTIAMLFLNLAIGFGMIWANKLQLMGLDEMQQRVQLHAMGATLGIGLVVGLAYANLDNHGFIAKADISHMVILMSVTYLVLLYLGMRRYQ